MLRERKKNETTQKFLRDLNTVINILLSRMITSWRGVIYIEISLETSTLQRSLMLSYEFTRLSFRPRRYVLFSSWRFYFFYTLAYDIFIGKL